MFPCLHHLSSKKLDFVASISLVSDCSSSSLGGECNLSNREVLDVVDMLSILYNHQFFLGERILDLGLLILLRASFTSFFWVLSIPSPSRITFAFSSIWKINIPGKVRFFCMAGLHVRLRLFPFFVSTMVHSL